MALVIWPQKIMSAENRGNLNDKSFWNRIGWGQSINRLCFWISIIKNKSRCDQSLFFTIFSLFFLTSFLQFSLMLSFTCAFPSCHIFSWLLISLINLINYSVINWGVKKKKNHQILLQIFRTLSVIEKCVAHKHT